MAIYTFPHDPLLTELLDAARRYADPSPIVHDFSGYQKSYSGLLGDVVETSRHIRTRLPSSALDDRQFLREQARNFAVFTYSGYEFIVAFFAIRAIGGTCMPLGPALFPEEVEYIASKTQTTCLLSGTQCVENVQRICDHLCTLENFKSCVSIPIQCNANPVEHTEIVIDDSAQMAPDGPGLILFSSGTTGVPKGVVLPRCCFSNRPYYQPGKNLFDWRPVHWIAGVTGLVLSVLSGTKLYTLGRDTSPRRLLDVFKSHKIHYAKFSPRILRALKDELTDENGHLSEERRAEWAPCFEDLASISNSVAMIEPSVKDFWTDLTGKPFKNAYGLTEMAGVAAVAKSTTTHDSIGKPVADVQMKLSEGNHGEIRLKSPRMLIGYIGDEDLTKASFDDEGYYKTGDLAEYKNGEYIFAGRANQDYVAYGLHRFPTFKVEHCLTELPYVSEACVVGVPSYDSIQLCGAAIRVPRNLPAEEVNLARIRSDMCNVLPAFMLPTLLRILKSEEDFPYTASGKVRKKQVIEKYFGTTNIFPANNMPEGVERSEGTKLANAEPKPWFWGGIQSN